MKCSLRYERVLRRAGARFIAGIDEAGRGPLAGPVVAAAVVLPENFRHPVLTDSKQLSAEQRLALYAELTAPEAGERGIYWAVSVVDHEEIDRINILRATHQGMRRALAALPVPVDHALIDGLPVNPFPVPQTAVVKGDAKSYSIAAASIIAKVTRDRIMNEMDALYPQYRFCQHKGYATPEHLARLEEYGPSPIHRRTFLPRKKEQLDLF